MTAWDALAVQRAGIPVFEPGHVWLAGAGPGDPGLLTLDALAGLTQADVVVHDALVDERVLALAGRRPRRVCRQARRQAVGEAGRYLRASGRAGARRPRVLRLKGGDPFVFGRGGEEAMTLRGGGHRLPDHSRCHRRPGGARRGRHSGDAARRQPGGDFCRRTRRGRRFRLAPARPHRAADRALHGDAQSRADRRGTDGGRARWRDAGRRDRFGETPRQRVLTSTLEKLAVDAREQKFEPPAIVVIGDIVNARTQLLGADAAADKEPK